MARDNDLNGKRGGKRPAQSPISDRQKKLAEEDARNRAEEARLQRMLQSAPKVREELVRKQRDEFIKRKAKVVHIDGPVDRRFEATALPRPAKARKMRKDRTLSQLLFVLLVVGFCLSLYYAFRVMGR